jgi:hypothetical protein
MVEISDWGLRVAWKKGTFGATSGASSPSEPAEQAEADRMSLCP